MGILSWLTRQRSSGQIILRQDIIMDYSAAIRKQGIGSAAVQWQQPDDSLQIRRFISDGSNSDEMAIAQIILTALLYTRVLHVHKQTRADLFSRVGDAIERYASSNFHELMFDDWYLDGDENFPIWPWHIVTPERIDSVRKNAAVGNPHTYVASLIDLERPVDRFRIHLQMGAWLARVAAPASPLISMTTLSQTLSPDFRELFAGMIFGINRFYGSPDNLGSIVRESEALSSVLLTFQEATGIKTGNA